jgi:small subunit ribosomal protein S7
MLRKRKYTIKYKKLKFRPDPFYRSLWFTKLINKLMYEGKKSLIEKYVWRAFWTVKNEMRKSGNVLLFSTLISIRPSLGFISTRLGREFKIVPIELFPRRQLVIALRWFVETVRSNAFFLLEYRLKSELLAFIKKEQSNLLKKEVKNRVEIYQNRLNARFRWWG